MALIPGKRLAAQRLLDVTGLNWLLTRVGCWSGLVVLNYHRIVGSTSTVLDLGVCSASAEEFDWQLDYLARNFEVVSPDELDHVLMEQRGRRVLITFDDGYRDNYSVAFPILCRHRLSATFLITTGFLDQPAVPWWDEIAWIVKHARCNHLPAVGNCPPQSLAEHEKPLAISNLQAACRPLSTSDQRAFLEELARAASNQRVPAALAADLWMTWKMVREMSDAGMHFGGHTMSHPYLAQLSADAQLREIAGCRSRIQQAIDRVPDVFAYPYGIAGSYDEVSRACVAEAGYRWAFGFQGGFAVAGQIHRFDLPRVSVAADMQRHVFRGRLALPQVFA